MSIQFRISALDVAIDFTIAIFLNQNYIFLVITILITGVYLISKI